ncbi:MAG: hypothetical protein LBQ22_07735 [Bacteroidales bacterium]|jgi:hypothetical protein|nr:hypothetical protein [Bacteroidales bacterium]
MQTKGKFTQFLLLFLIALTPLLGLPEMIDFLSIPVTVPVLYVKLPKDILIILIAVLNVFYILYNRNYSKRLLVPLFILIIFTLFVLVLSINDLQIVIAGIRWILPVFLIFLLYGTTIDTEFLNKVANTVSILILLNIVIQIYEMFNMPPVWGNNYFGLTGRLPGFFSQASPAGIFGAFCFYLIRYYGTLKYNKIFLMISAISIFLSMSSMGVALFLLLVTVHFFIKSKNEYKLLTIFVFIPVLFAGLTNLDKLTGREENSTTISGSARIAVLKEQIVSSQFISTKFGQATNTSQNFVRKLDLDNDSFVADSFYTSILTNYGYLFFILFAMYLFYLAIIIFNSKNIPLIMFFIISMVSAISIIVSEIFPMNLLIAILSAYFIKHKQIKFHK